MRSTDDKLRSRLEKAWRDLVPQLERMAAVERDAFFGPGAGTFRGAPSAATDFVSFDSDVLGALRRHWEATPGGREFLPLVDALAQAMGEVTLEEGTTELPPFTYVLY